MKLFESFLRDCAVLGLGPHQSTAMMASKYPFNRKIVQTCLILGSVTILSYSYLFLEAKTFQEYAMSVYVTSTFLLSIAAYLIFVWKNGSICELIDTARKITNDSESDL